jgi:hypothetical protein
MTTIELKKKLSNPDRFKIKTDYNFLMGFPRILILLVSLLIINNAHAIVYVDKDRNGNGTSWDNAYNSIEAAIAATGDNQEFWVAEGTYTPSSNAFWGTQLIPKQGSQFYGGFTGNETSRDQRDVSAHPTIIDGGPNNLIHVILIKLETKDVTIDGFTIKNGSATGDGSDYWDKFGGGIFADIVEESGHNTTILNCTFENNTATEQGGAVFINRRNATFQNCVFQSNNSKTGGALGATDTDLVYDATLTLSDCTFNSNQANLGAATSQRGGAIWTLKLSTLIQRSTFTGNSAGQLGGAVEFNQPRSATVADCEFTNNQTVNATSGGGAIAGMWDGVSEKPSLTITGSSFINNASLLEGGGVYSYYCQMLIQDSRFQGNTGANGGAVMLDYKIAGASKVSRIEGCLFMGNTATTIGGALRSYARSIEIDNSVFAFNSAPDAGAIGFHAGSNSDYDPAYAVTLRNCSLYGNSATGYGGAVLNTNVPMLYAYNCIFWENQGDQEIWDSQQGAFVGTHDVFNAASSSMTTRYTDMETLYWNHGSVSETHTGSFSANPLFVDPDGADNTRGTLDDNLRLKSTSPCNDRADGANAPATDIEGDARVDLPNKPNLGTGTPDYGDLGPYETVAGNLTIMPQITILFE